MTDATAASIPFKACGQPAPETVVVGGITCRYCPKHAAEARAFVMEKGQEEIARLQRKAGVI